jgi:hypothetical protein
MRRARLTLLGILLCALGGCIYLRLYDLKGQFADFDANLRIAGDHGGLSLVFLHPLLLADDAATLIGGPPSAVITTPGADPQLVFRFRRVPLPASAAAAPPAPGDTVAIVFAIHDGHIARVDFPPLVFRVVPPALASAMLRALGHARVDRVQRSATTSVDAAAIAAASATAAVAAGPASAGATDAAGAAAPLAPGGLASASAAATVPGRAEIAALFGRADEIVAVPGYERHLYRYRLDPPPGPPPPPPAPADSDEPPPPADQPPGAQIGFLFRPGVPTVQRFQASINGLWLYVDLPGALPPAPPPRPAASE